MEEKDVLRRLHRPDIEPHSVCQKELKQVKTLLEMAGKFHNSCVITVSSGVPEKDEILEQLERMLASKRFKNAKSQSNFLSLIVRRAVAGKMTTMGVVTKELFPAKVHNAEATDVRVTAVNLRATLKKYFENEGYDDPVRIVLPEPSRDKSVAARKGTAYTPAFSYHPFQSIAILIKAGNILLLQNSLASAVLAQERFELVLKEKPNHVEALIGLAESFCNIRYWWKGHEQFNERVLEKKTLEAFAMLKDALSLAPKHWRIQAVAGFLCFEMGNLEFAKNAFRDALAMSRANTQSYVPYMRYVAHQGDRKQAQRLAERYLEARLGNPQAWVVYADILIICGQHEFAS